MYTSFGLTASTMGRLSSNDPNLQNIPIRTEEGRKIRRAFTAAPRPVLISADYSQFELRLLAHIGDIPELKRAFAAGLDIHAATTSEMFGVPVEGMPRSKSVAQRQLAERAAINAPIQGSVADIIRRAMVRMPEALRAAGLETRMLLQVHDELVFEAPEAEADRVCSLVSDVMRRTPEPAVALSVPLVVDARAVSNWDEAH